MAGRIDRFLKERLQAAGRWQAFQERRDELKEQGYSPDDARMAALAEVMPQCDDADSGPAGRAGGDALPLAPAALAGRTACEPEIARWVARNIDNPSPDPAECPDPFAWTLLRMCRDNPAFALMFVKDIWTKLLVSQARQDDGGKGEGEMDGTPTLKLIERIREMRDKANREVAGPRNGEPRRGDGKPC
jgi:hypothetical protein